MFNFLTLKKITGDAHTPQPGEIVFEIMRYRSETVQRSEDFQCHLCRGQNNVYLEKITFKRDKMYVKIKY